MGNSERQLALSGKWVPVHRQECWYIDQNGYRPLNDDEPTYGSDYLDVLEAHSERGYKFFPTKGLLVEYLYIANGNWVPRIGDTIFACDSKTRNWAEGTWDESSIAFMQNHSKRGDYHFFPSQEQMNAYFSVGTKTIWSIGENNHPEIVITDEERDEFLKEVEDSIARQ